MKIEQKSDGYYKVSFATQKGTTGEVNLGTTDSGKAVEMVEEMRVEKLETISGIVDLTHQVVTQIVSGKNLTVKDAIELWIKHLTETKIQSSTTIHANHGFASHWAKESNVEDRPLSCVKPLDILLYINRGNERRSTALRKLCAIRSFFGYCQAEGYSYRNPAAPSAARVTYDAFTHEDLEPREKPTFTPEEIAALLEHANEFWKAAITLGLTTGLRLGDICQLEWASIKGDRLIVWTDKTNKRVDVPLTPDILSSMRALSVTSLKYCFPEQQAISVDPTRRALLSVQFSRLCKKAGLRSSLTFHCLRHSNATNLVNDGATVEEVAKLLGHSSTETTKKYLHVGGH